MTTHDHDPDLIMALAEGSVPDDSRPGAEAEVAACRECAADLAVLRALIETLRTTPPAVLTEMESAAIRRALRRDLELVVETRRAPRVATWNRWLAVGAAAAVLVGVVSVAPRLDLLGSGDTASDVAALSQTTRVAAAEDAAGGVEDAPDILQSATAVPDVSDADLENMLAELDARNVSEAAAANELSPRSCADTADGRQGDEAALRVTARYRDLTVEIVGYDDGTDKQIVVYDAATCDVVTTIAGDDTPAP